MSNTLCEYRRDDTYPLDIYYKINEEINERTNERMNERWSKRTGRKNNEKYIDENRSVCVFFCVSL